MSKIRRKSTKSSGNAERDKNEGTYHMYIRNDSCDHGLYRWPLSANKTSHHLYELSFLLLFIFFIPFIVFALLSLTPSYIIVHVLE